MDRFPAELSYCLHPLIGFDVGEADHGGRLTVKGSVWSMVAVEIDPAPDASFGLQSGLTCVQIDAFFLTLAPTFMQGE